MLDPAGHDYAGQHRFSPVLSDDHAGYLWIVTIVGIIYSFMAGSLRYHIKFGVWGWDDYFLWTATLFHLTQAAVLFYGMSNGLGKANSITDPYQWQVSGQTLFAAQLLSVTSLCLSKCSVVALLVRIFAPGTGKGFFVCLAALAMCMLWGVGSILALAVNCTVNTLLTAGDRYQCPQQLLRWQFITTFDIVTEIIIVLLPAVLIWSLNMPRKLKFQVIFAFLFRLPLIALNVVHIVHFVRYLDSADEPQLAITPSLAWNQVMLTWSLLSATIPNLKSFMKTFSMAMSIPVVWDGPNLTNLRSFPLRSLRGLQKPIHHSASRAFAGGRQLSSLDTRLGEQDGFRMADLPQRRAAGRPQDNADSGRPGGARNETTILSSKTDTKGDLTDDDQSTRSRPESREFIIRRSVQWDDQHEPSR